MSITLSLRCDECDHSVNPQLWLTLTKMGTFRLEGSAEGFYIDGARTLCNGCAGERKNCQTQRETWHEHDRLRVERDQEEERFLDAIVARYPGLERRR